MELDKENQSEYIKFDPKEVQKEPPRVEFNFLQKLHDFRLMTWGVLVAKRYLELYTEAFKRHRIPATAIPSLLECMVRNWNDVQLQRSCAVYTKKEKQFKPITDKTEAQALREAIIDYLRPSKDFERENAKCFEKKEKNKRKRK